MKFPLLIINFKVYKTAIDENAEKLAVIADKIAKETGKNIMIAVSAPDIYRVTQKVSIPVLSEHMDPTGPGANTGDIIAEDIKDNGAKGSLLNHSEDPYQMEDLKEAIKRAKENNLLSVACAKTPEEAKKIEEFKPDLIAIEPPELIGGDISVSTAKPEIITDTVNNIKNIPVLCGAGVKTKEDVQKALELGAKGILLASGVTKAEDPEEEIRELLSAF
jgi:triosephosphate isomerase